MWISINNEPYRLKNANIDLWKKVISENKIQFFKTYIY